MPDPNVTGSRTKEINIRIELLHIRRKAMEKFGENSNRYSSIVVALSICIAAFPCAYGIPFEEWNKTFDDGYCARSVQQTIDDGYVATGESSYHGTVMLLKTDSAGNELWNKKYGDLWSEGLSVQQTSDQGYIALGSINEKERSIWVIKTDSFGNELWNKSYGERSIRAYGTSIQQTRDEGYIILGAKEEQPMPSMINTTSSNGVASSQGEGVASIWLIKTDSSGNKIWDNTYGGLKYDQPRSVQQIEDGGYVIIGTTRSYGDSESNIWLIRTDSLGNKLWDKTFGGSNAEGSFVQQTTDGGFVLLGNTDDILLIKTDTDGNKIWDKTFSLSLGCKGYEVLQTIDGGYILVGITADKQEGWDAFLIKTDLNGNKLWDKTFGRSKWDYGFSVDLTKDGGYIVAGMTRSSNDNDVCWLIKVRDTESTNTQTSTGAIGEKKIPPPPPHKK